MTPHELPWNKSNLVSVIIRNCRIHPPDTNQVDHYKCKWDCSIAPLNGSKGFPLPLSWNLSSFNMVTKALHYVAPIFFRSLISCHSLPFVLHFRNTQISRVSCSYHDASLYSYFARIPSLPVCLVNTYWLLNSSATSTKSVLSSRMIRCSHLTHPKALHICH